MKLPLIAATLVFSLSWTWVFAQEPPPVPVRTVPLRRESLARRVAAYGTVMVAQDVQTDISLPYGAEISRLHAGVGSKLKRGDPLFSVSADPGAILAMQQAQGAVVLARGELQRTQSLEAQRLATLSQVAAAEKAVTDAEQALAAQRRLGVGEGEQIVRSPFDGVMLKLLVSQGDRLQPGTVILQLGRSDPATPSCIVLGIDPSLRKELAAGASVEITSLSTPADSSPPASIGHVREVRAVVNPQSRMVEILVNLPSSESVHLITGEPVQGIILLPAGEHWVVPRPAVLRDAHGAYLYQVEKGRARRVPVDVRVDNGDQLAVDGALQTALPIVVEGNYQLTDGQQVRGAAP